MKIKTVLAMAIFSMLIGCSPSTPQERLKNAEAFIESGNDKRAIVELKSLVQDSPSDIAARKTLGFLLFKVGDLGGAVSQLTRVVELGDSSSEVMLTLQMSLYHQKQYESVLLVVNSLERKLTPFETLVDFLAAKQLDAGVEKNLIQARRHSSATSLQLLNSYSSYFEGQYERALEMLPSLSDTPKTFHYEYKLFKSAIFRFLGKYEHAFNLVNEVADAWPKVPSVAMNAIEIGLVSGNEEASELRLNEWLKSSPQAVWVNYFKGIMEAENGNFTTAINHFETAINGGLDSGDVWLLHGIVASQLKLWETAYSSFETAYLRNKSSTALALLAETQLQLGENEKALKSIKKVISNNNVLASPYVKRAATYLDFKGLGSDAVEIYDEYLSSYEDAEKNLEEVIQLEVLKSKNGLPLAAKNLNLMMSERGGSSISQYLNIKNLLDKGDITQAREMGQNLTKEYGASAADIAALVEMYARDFASARQYAQSKLGEDADSKLAKRVLFLSLYELGEFQEAFETAYALAKDEPSNRQISIDTVALLFLNESPELVEQFEQELSQLKRKNELITEFGVALADQGKRLDAIKFLKGNQSKLPVSGFQLLIDLLLGEGDFENALRVSDEWRSVGDTPKAAALAKLAVLASNEKYKEAVDFGQGVLSDFNNDPRINVYLYKLYKDQGDYSKALIEIERIAEKSVPTSLVKLFESEIAIEMKQYDKAIKYLISSHNLTPTYLTAVTLGKLLTLKNRASEATEIMANSYQQLELKDEKRLHSFAEYFLSVGNVKKAIDIYLDMEELGITSIVLYANLGEAFYRIGDLQNALKSTEKAAKTNVARYSVQLAKFLYESGRKSAAIKTLRDGVLQNLSDESELKVLYSGAIELGLDSHADLIKESFGRERAFVNKKWQRL